MALTTRAGSDTPVNENASNDWTRSYGGRDSNERYLKHAVINQE